MTQEKILDRIKKLLSLSKSTNEHEAALAAAHAAKLMMEHNIAEAALADDETGNAESVEEECIDSTGRLIQWRAQILAGLANAFDCRFYVGNTRSASTGKPRRRYMVVGQPSKQATVRYMYAYLISEVDRLADSAYYEEVTECSLSGVSRPSARGWKNGFRFGASVIIRDRLEEQRTQSRADARAAGQGQALMRIDQQALAIDDYMKRNLNLAPIARAQVSSRSGYSAGKQAGARVSLGNSGPRLGAGARRLKN